MLRFEPKPLTLQVVLRKVRLHVYCTECHKPIKTWPKAGTWIDEKIRLDLGFAVMTSIRHPYHKRCLR